MRLHQSVEWICVSIFSAGAAIALPSVALAVGPIPGQTCSGVTLSSGASIQDAVANNLPGTTFCLTAGTYDQPSIVPKDADQFIGAFGAVLDGQNTIAHAFSGSARNVVIQNLTITNYKTAARNGLFSDSELHGDTSYGWVVKNNELAYNWGAGLDIGSQMQITGNYIHHNAQIGIDTNFVAGVDPTTVLIDVVVDSNEIAYNNYRHDFDPGWEAGGAKFWGTINLRVTNIITTRTTTSAQAFGLTRTTSGRCMPTMTWRTILKEAYRMK